MIETCKYSFPQPKTCRLLYSDTGAKVHQAEMAAQQAMNSSGSHHHLTHAAILNLTNLECAVTCLLEDCYYGIKHNARSSDMPLGSQGELSAAWA